MQTNQESRVGNRKKSNKQIKFIVSGIVIVAAITYLIVNALAAASQYFFTVSELLERGESMVGRSVRISGLVAPNSIHWDAETFNLKFDLADDSRQLSVVFHGPKPDNMEREGAEAILEGQLQPDGSFKASTLMLKCPSRYEEGTPQVVKALP